MLWSIVCLLRISLESFFWRMRLADGGWGDRIGDSALVRDNLATAMTSFGSLTPKKTPSLSSAEDIDSMSVSVVTDEVGEDDEEVFMVFVENVIWSAGLTDSIWT